MPGDEATTPREPRTQPDPAIVQELLEATGRLATERGREDLAADLVEAARRAGRTDTIICVVGEFKQGKSALINALLGSDVCPVDDDLATMAVTIVRYADRPSATIRRRDGDQLVVETIPPDEIADWVTERENPENRRRVELVEVGLPSPFLEAGVTLVDTPGVGGLNAAHAAATLAFLPTADALVFVSDASAELSGPEIEFLASARQSGPPILVGLTKIDMYPEWRRIEAIDDRRLGLLDGDIRTFPVSAELRAAGLRLGDPALEAASGFPPFADALVRDVAGEATAAVLAGALRELRSSLDQLRDPLAAELEAIERPDEAGRMIEELATVRSRLDRLSDSGSTWSSRLDDEFKALRTRTEFAFRGRIRQVVRDAQDEIETIDPAAAWPAVSQKIQAQVAAAVREAFLGVTEGAAAAQATVARLLTDEDLRIASPEDDVSFDVAGLWKGSQAFGGGLRTGVLASFGLLAGASVGVEMLGMLGALLGTALVGPVMLGAALFFGGKEVADQRRRQLTERRQQAREFVAGFAEDVQFEVDGRLGSLASELQAQMRIRFADRIAELGRTYRDTAGALERLAERSETERARRLTEIPGELAAIDALAARADAIERGLPSAA